MFFSQGGHKSKNHNFSCVFGSEKRFYFRACVGNVPIVSMNCNSIPSLFLVPFLLCLLFLYLSSSFGCPSFFGPCFQSSVEMCDRAFAQGTHVLLFIQHILHSIPSSSAELSPSAIFSAASTYCDQEE